MFAPRVHDHRPFLIVLAALVVLCWLALFGWGLSPYGSYLDHRLLGEHDLALNREYASLAGLFIIGWTLMTVAMMLARRLMAGAGFR